MGFTKKVTQDGLLQKNQLKATSLLLGAPTQRQEPQDWQQFYVCRGKAVQQTTSLFAASMCPRNYEELKQAVVKMAEEEEEDVASRRGRLMCLGLPRPEMRLERRKRPGGLAFLTCMTSDQGGRS